MSPAVSWRQTDAVKYKNKTEVSADTKQNVEIFRCLYAHGILLGQMTTLLFSTRALLCTMDLKTMSIDRYRLYSLNG